MTKPKSTTLIVVLAAGEGKRFGGVKQLAHLEGSQKCLLEHSLHLIDELEAELKGELEKVAKAVVLGAHSNAILRHHNIQATLKGFAVLENTLWREGLSTSIVRSVAHAEQQDCGAIMFVLADQVSLTANGLKKVLAAYKAEPQRIIASHYNDTLGVPAVFPASYFAELKSLQGDKGAGALIKKNKNCVMGVDLPEAVWDIDTPEKLNEWNTDFKTRHVL
jgi:molybdenum cofactor cytidylyltransferase